MTEEELRGWVSGRIPSDWFTAQPRITVDRDEILIVGPLAEPSIEGEADAGAARAGRIRRFREETREQRMRVAREIEHRTGRTVSWGAECGDTVELFTTLSVPVMTRLRMSERSVLDTLVRSGIARSRSEALAWCVRLVAGKQAEWLGELEEALQRVRRVRDAGPAA